MNDDEPTRPDRLDRQPERGASPTSRRLAVLTRVARDPVSRLRLTAVLLVVGGILELCKWITLGYGP